MSSVVTLEERPIAPELGRESQMRSVTISATLADGTTIAAACERAQALAEPLLAAGMRVVPLAEAATLDETAGSLALTFGFALLIVGMVLAAQFESFTSALIIMATVPFGLGCAVVAMVLTGVSLNVYSQIGLVLLVGIIAKNGILVVEFADQLRDHGAGVREAIEEACRIRLRPVMMTMIATILGGVPLLVFGGAGAEARARARLGHRRRPRARDAADPVRDAGRLPGARPLLQAARRRDRAARARARRGRLGAAAVAGAVSGPGVSRGFRTIAKLPLSAQSGQSWRKSASEVQPGGSPY